MGILFEKAQHDWTPKTVTLHSSWLEEDLDGVESLLLFVIAQYADEDQRITFTMGELASKLTPLLGWNRSDLQSRDYLQNLADRGLIIWNTFRYLKQDWHSVKLTDKGRSICGR